MMNAIVMAILKKLFPYEPPPGARVRRLEDLRADYQWWETCGAVPYLAFAVAISGFCYVSLRWLAQWNARGLHGSHFLLLPEPEFWLLPALFLGLIFAALPMHVLYKALLRDRYEEYTMYCNLKAGFDTWKICRWLAIVILSVSALDAAAGLTARTAVTDRAIIIKSPLSLRERVYTFDQIDAIASIAGFKRRSGEFLPDPYYAVRFTDGSMWKSRDGLQNHKAAEIPALIEFLAKRSGRPIKTVQVINDFAR
jgi:hypothetical protein